MFYTGECFTGEAEDADLGPDLLFGSSHVDVGMETKGKVYAF